MNVWVSFLFRRCAASDFAFFFFFNDTATTEIYTLSLHDALPIRVDRVGFHHNVSHQSALLGFEDLHRAPPEAEPDTEGEAGASLGRARTSRRCRRRKQLKNESLGERDSA